MNDAIQDSNKIKRGKASISPLMNENTKDIILLVQDISNVYDITSDENSILNKIKEEINELENYINSTHNHLNKAIEEIKLIEKNYLDELQNRENKDENNLKVNNSNIENNLSNLFTSKCEEIERELSNIHDKYALLLEKKKQLLKSMRDSEEVLLAKKKMYQNISMISWSLISDSFIQGHFIPVNSPIKTESFQLQISEYSKLI